MKGLDGLLKCYIHNESFNEIEGFDKHCEEAEHHVEGHTACSECGSPNVEVDYDGKLVGGKRAQGRCEKCEKSLLKKLQEKHKK